MDNDLTGFDDFTFSYEEQEAYSSQMQIVDLVKGGRNIIVTNENKKKFVKLLCEAKMSNNIKTQVEHFLKGFT